MNVPDGCDAPHPVFCFYRIPSNAQNSNNIYKKRLFMTVLSYILEERDFFNRLSAMQVVLLLNLGKFERGKVHVFI